MVKVYNKGVKPIVWKRDLKGTEAIHPRKFDLFSDKKAKELIEKFTDAVSEEDYKKHVDEQNKKATRDSLELMAENYKIKFTEKTTNDDLKTAIEKYRKDRKVAIEAEKDKK